MTAKAWRFEGEMQEIADTFEGAGLPGGFHRAATEIYGRLATIKDVSQRARTYGRDRRFAHALPARKSITFTSPLRMTRYAEGVGKKDRIKRLHDVAKRLDQAGEAYIYDRGELENGVNLVWLFGRSVTSHTEATLALHDELQRQALDPADLLRVMKRKRDEAALEAV